MDIIKAGEEINGVIRPARPYLFKIELDPDGMINKIKNDAFYDCAWFIADKGNNTGEIVELQDLDCRQYAKNKSPVLQPKSLYKVTDGKLDFAQFDEASPIQA